MENTDTSPSEKLKATILIAEDDPEVASTLLNVLVSHQYDVSLATDGEQALTLLLEKKYDIVILDLKMPKIGGFGILKYIKLNVPETKVIILTAYADLKNIEECQRLGADHVIGKPYDLEMLFWTIDLVLKK
jgi:CheY-like chemotaxis protein